MNFLHKKETFIIILCISVALTSVAVCLHIFFFKGSDIPADETQNESESVTQESHTETYSPQSPKSLEYKSLGIGKCAVAGIGGYTGSDLNIPEKSPYGETVISISAEAFKDCTSIVSIYIPATVQSIGENAFIGCSSLVLFSVDSKNPYFSSADSILYSKSKSTLICCPQRRIGNSYLLDPNVKVISSNAFYGVKNLSKILYEGSPADFEKISVGKGNQAFTSLPITCNYTGTK